MHPPHTPCPNRSTPALVVALAVAFASLLFPGCSPAPDTATGAGPTVPFADLGYASGTYTLDGEPFTGVATESHPDGVPSKHYSFRDGVPHGVIREWAPNGTLIVETHFENGERHGMNTYWNDDGSLMKEQRYHRDKSVSTKYYNKPGHAE